MGPENLLPSSLTFLVGGGGGGRAQLFAGSWPKNLYGRIIIGLLHTIFFSN